jgi:hypothetical protein
MQTHFLLEAKIAELPPMLPKSNDAGTSPWQSLCRHYWAAEGRSLQLPIHDHKLLAIPKGCHAVEQTNEENAAQYDL